MIFDETNLFHNGVITVTADGTNVINLGADRDIGLGNPVQLLIQVTTAFTAGGAATMTTVLETDDNSAMSSSEDLWDSGAIAVATLVAGYTFGIRYMPRTNQQYLGLVFTIATGPMTAGALIAGIVYGDQSNGANV